MEERVVDKGEISMGRAGGITKPPVPSRRSIGAEWIPGEGVRFRIWSPDQSRVEVLTESESGRSKAYMLPPDGDGYLSALVPDARPGTLYRYRLNAELLVPDPASRFQPEGPNGPSEVIDPAAFAWTDHSWRGLELSGQVLSEMHVGTFTPEGTWKAAIDPLSSVAEMGFTAIELLPVADFPGRWGWSYDGVNLFAPTRNYGRPDDFRQFVDEAHRLGLGVILDVVFNHLGPQDNVLRQVTPRYFSSKHMTEWGEGLNWDGHACGPVREYFLENVAYWVEEFHVDGLRIDAAHEFRDSSNPHILTALAHRAREAAGSRRILIFAENEPQQADLVRPVEEGGRGLDAVWSEDFHHVAVLALTGRREGYYADYHGSPQEFVSLLKQGFLYQGQFNARQGKRRGSRPDGLLGRAFVSYLENHDQVANWFGGKRLRQRTPPDLFRAVTAYFLLAPATPLLFQGQEYGSTRPFHYFTDLEESFAKAISEGRRDFVTQFASMRSERMLAAMTDPANPSTFERAKLDPSERDRFPEISALHRDLIRLRREDPIFREQGEGGLDGAVLSDCAFVARYRGRERDERLLLVNLGGDLAYWPVSEPLLAPPEGRDWSLIWSSEEPRYGGSGQPEPARPEAWFLPARSTMVFGTKVRPEDEH